MLNLIKFIFVALLCAAAQSTLAQNAFVQEDPVNIRFEQYTGAAGNIVFWRLPTPGTSNFPDSTCKSLQIPSDRVEHASRFMALYLFAKTNAKQIFYAYSPTTCVVVSFGIDG